jgi:hypothetical protein
MRTLIAAAMVVAAVAVLAADQGSMTHAAGGPVVVELFTSEGCSSCPPADQLLRRLAADPALRGRVIPLAYHVDYWNYLGWRDPFSTAAWTQRQNQYVHAFALGGAYTPQAVVAGSRELIGSNESALRAAIRAAAASRDDASVQLSLEGETAVVTSNARQAGLELILATTEDDVTTRVQRGENGGRALTEGSIVRRLDHVGAVPAGNATRRVPVPIDRGWNRSKVNVVALLQDPKTLRIHAAAMAALK